MEINLKLTISFLLPAAFILLLVGCGFIGDRVTDIEKLTGTRILAIPSIEDETCERLAKDPWVLDFMAEKYINPFTGKPQKEVLRITSQREISRTDERLVCGGTVKWNDGTKDDIEFSRKVDAEGDNWTNWEIKE